MLSIILVATIDLNRKCETVSCAHRQMCRELYRECDSFECQHGCDTIQLIVCCITFIECQSITRFLLYECASYAKNVRLFC